MHINKIEVVNFRGLRNVHFDDLKRINYIVGRNNSGKTSVLEALVVGGCYSDIDLLLDTILARSQKRFIDGVKNLLIPEEMERSEVIISFDEGTICTDITCADGASIVQMLDSGLKSKRKITVSFESEFSKLSEIKKDKFWINFEETEKTISYRKDPNFNWKDSFKIPCQFISFSRFDRTDKILNYLDGVFLNNQREQLLNVLRIFDPEVENFEVVGEKRQILIIKNKKEHSMPLYLNDYGNGMYKAFYIACAALVAENGILLIDELEAGIHHKALEEFVSYLDKISNERNIQFIVTTHSLELIDIARNSHGDALAIYNIKMNKNKNGNTIVKRIGEEEIQVLRGDLGLDIR